MRKRRVGVTARSRQTGDGQATGRLQVDTEMAAPPELRTPTGTAAKGRNESADGSKATEARESVWQRAIQKNTRAVGACGHKAAARVGTLGDSARSAHEALPPTPPGGKPPETPGPLSLDPRFYASQRICPGFASPAQNAALDRSPGLPTGVLRRGKGGLWQTGGLPPPPRGRPRTIRCYRPTPRSARRRRCLLLRQGASPLRPPPRYLTRTGLLMEAVTEGSGCQISDGTHARPGSPGWRT